MKRILRRLCGAGVALALLLTLAPAGFAAQPLPAMDVCFLVDTSGSMEAYLPDAIAACRAMMDELTASGLADLRFALIDYRDDPEKTAMEADYPYQIQTDFTSSADALFVALGALDTGYGGDMEESVYSAIVDGLARLGWREGAGRAAVLLGDAPALDPESGTGYTLADALVALNNLGVTLHSVTALPAWEPEPAPLPGFAALSEATGGLAVLLAESESVAQVLVTQAQNLPKPAEPEQPPYEPNLGLPGSLTLYRKEDCAVFRAVDTAQISWKSSNPGVLTVDGSGNVQYRFARVGKTTVTAYDESDRVLAVTEVKVDWQWWQWVLVILLFGWIYL
ncbi:MAG: hypothetical protein LBC83_08105 [Oscillospiraceae bacterium]|jgi:hypothetical protein|nr:hypothetical protein [Oscillospiraceae bacterium]